MRYHPAAVFALGFLARAWLIHSYPILFGGDSITRLVHHDRILIAYQLPALQASIHLLMRLREDPILARYWMAVIGAAAGVAFYYLAAGVIGRPGAFPAALLFASNPFLVAHSTVPYQEILMVMTLFCAFHYRSAGHNLAAGLALGVACLTRYEAWAACPVLIAAHVIERGRRPVEIVKALALFGWAPLGWMLLQGGVAPAGTYVIEGPVSAARLVRYVYLGWITVKFTPVVVTALGALGLWRALRQRMLLGPRFRILAAFFALFLLAILFSAHGVDPDPERFVTAREAHLPVAALILLAGIGLARLPRYRAPLAAAGVVLGLWGAARFLERETAEPHLRLSYDLARYLDGALGSQQTALLLVASIPPGGVDVFLERARRTGGEANAANARRLLEREAATAPDFQRTWVHSRVARDRLWGLVSAAMSAPARRRQLAAAPPPDWIVVWSDFAPTDPDEARYYEMAKASGPPVETLRAGALAATVYRIRR